ncbi:MAG: SpoIIE family protein phosphatase [Acidobacteria bacterium]|nr:SpoIIE family protein phosphatase [Acidobacteriota bacterium]MDA1235560.1 SpoIIE family protein phosphatase [Acidobacteriota bacterium]
MALVMDLEARLKQLEGENARLRGAVEELSILNQVAVAVASTSTLDEIIDLVVQECVKHLHVEQGAVMLLDDGKDAAPLKTMIRKARSDYSGVDFRLNDQLTGWMMKNQASLLVNDLASDARFQSAAAGTVRSLICAPLKAKGRLIGVLSVFNKRKGESFSKEDERLLTIIAAQSAQVVEHARLYEEEQALHRVEQELETARTIQQRLLPTEAPSIPGYDIAGMSLAARQVGGDYFDFISMTDGMTGLCVADVSGKGITAALLMAVVQAKIRGQSLVDSSMAERLEVSNRLIHHSTPADKFVTMFYAALDADNHRLRYSNAGHNPPFLIPKKGEARLLESGGPVLGVLPNFKFEESTVNLEVGDLLVIYTDGFSEAINPALEEFGEDRLLEVARGVGDQSAQQILETLSEEVRIFCGAEPQFDDMTIMALRRTS